jgi:hypothetical protein
MGELGGPARTVLVSQSPVSRPPQLLTHDFPPRSIARPSRSSFAVVFLLFSPYQETTSADKGDYSCSQGPIPRHPVLQAM